MKGAISLFAAIFIFAASIACASTTAVLQVRCVIPVLPPLDLSEAEEKAPQGSEAEKENRGFIIQTEERQEEDSRIVIRTAVAK